MNFLAKTYSKLKKIVLLELAEAKLKNKHKKLNTCHGSDDGNFFHPLL